MRLRQASATACLPPSTGSAATVARRDIGGDGERLLRAVDAHHAGVAAGRCTVSPMTMWSYCSQIQRREAELGRGHQSCQRVERWLFGRRHPLGQHGRGRRRDRSRGGRTSAPRRRAPATGRSASTSPLCLTIMRPVSVVLPMTAKSSPHLREDRFGLGLAAGLQHHQHALLALRQHHLVGGHAGFALGHLVEVELDADAALGGHFDGGGGEARRAHVLDGDDARRSPSVRGTLRSAAFR